MSANATALSSSSSSLAQSLSQPARSAPLGSQRPAAPPTQRAPLREEPAFTTRRPQAPPMTAQAPASGPQRERATFVPPLDADWDTPAFQRRQH